LPKRFSRAALIKQFPRTLGLSIVKRFSPNDETIKAVVFDANTAPTLRDINNSPITGNPAETEAMMSIKMQLETVFSADAGFDHIIQLNYIDGVRIYFSNGDIAHLRPSGNADELRIYTVSDSQIRADEIAAKAVAEPDGLLRKLARSMHRMVE
jgi:phosphomannomutase